MEKGQYSTWAELFKIHCRAYKVIDFIIPSTTSDTGKELAPEASAVDPKLKSQLNATVLQWIYGTISIDLLNTILEPDSTAQQAWERLKNIFQDNKNSRAVYLENQFSHVLQMIFECLAIVELKCSRSTLKCWCPVSNQRLVLQLIAGLNEAYDGVATIIQRK
ncbi:hypothetical protein K2173_000372 [Erythroxylum novogranatense]|uniref:Retrovirus-related Pol polyprotein from transposon TNT 1-94 n=1 Tax=Erythroxylum novogranatense TaxID=1862640 RepID=A0AAV8SW40_9ROSI|nr:hypothetical protein K2173_000372 [Erythroxylum novogranatense]